MLKFADLSVDFKSYENSLGSYMKLFPGSYTPLPIMYLAHEGLLKLVYEFDENDPRILVSVDGNSLHDFFGDWIMQDLIPDPNVWNQEKMTLEEAIHLINSAILKDRDFYVMQPLVRLWPLILAGKSVALIAEVPEDDQIVDLIKCIVISDQSTESPAALLYFSMMLMIKYEPLPTTDDVEKKTLEEIEINKRLDLEWWIEDFENTLEKILSYAGNKECLQPTELTRVILTQRNGGSIYNPFAGLASYATQLHYNLELDEYEESAGIGDYYYGEEIKDLIWAVGKLRLLAYHSDSKNYDLADSVEWRGGIANNVISTPPFGMQIENEEGKKEYADHFVIRRGLDMLADKGFLACVVPMSFMTRNDTTDLRKRLVESGWLESIVYLPENLFEETSIRSAIIFIRKKAHKKVNLINATKRAILRKRGKVNVLDEELVANLLDHDSFPKSFVYESGNRFEDVFTQSDFDKMKIKVETGEIVQHVYDLTPGLYFADTVQAAEGCKLMALRDIILDVPKAARKNGTGLVITPSMLSKDDFTILRSEMLSEDMVRRDFCLLTQDALLYSPTSSLRPTLFSVSREDSVYYKPSSVQAVYINENIVVPEYVVFELNKPYVKEQIELLASGSIVPRLSLDKFLEIRINIPISKSASAAFELHKAMHYGRHYAELAALKDQQHEEYIKMLRQRKHRIQQIMNEFAPAFTLLNKCRKDHDGVLHDNDVVASRTGETVEDYFEKLDTIVAKVEYLVTNLVDKDVWGKTDNVNIDDFIDEISGQHLLEKFDIQPVHYRDFEIEEEGEYDLNDSRMIIINRDDLATLFDNIIANASKWGFVDDVLTV